jgi:Zn-dependent protease
VLRPQPQDWRLGWLAGVEIKVNPSLLFIALLVTIQMAGGLLPATVPGLSFVVYLVFGVLLALIFIGSILWHEMAHVIMAIRYGIPVMQVVLHLFGGVALLSRDPERPTHEFVIAVAGPISSLVLAAAFGVMSAAPGLVGAGTGWLAQVNLTLALFNLLPGFPLDGGRVLRSVLWHNSGSYKAATRQASRVGQIVAGLFVAFALWLTFSGAWFNGVWFLVLAAFLYSAASQAFAMAAGSALPTNTPVRQVMRINVPLIEPTMPLAILAWRYLDHARDQAFPVVHEQHLVGLVTSFEVDKHPRLDWGRIRVEHVMIPADKVPTVRPTDSIATAMAAMDEKQMAHAPVVLDGVVVGMLNRRDIVYRT